MAKSIRSKREKRLRAIRRDMTAPLFDKKDEVKLAALEAALAAPKVPVRTKPLSPFEMDGVVTESSCAIASNQDGMDLEMRDGNGAPKPLGTKLKKKLKFGKSKRRGKEKFKRKHH